MVDSFKDRCSLYRIKASIGRDTKECSEKFLSLLLPIDYIRFLKMHDGFAKSIDTAMIRNRNLVEVYDAFLASLVCLNLITFEKVGSIEPKNLITFYEYLV
jgi:hypothetical protein